LSQLVKAFWEAEAGRQRDRFTTLRDENQAILERDLLMGWLSVLKPERLLEVGCGNGAGLSLFSKFSKRADGIDYSEPFIKAAREKYPNLEFYVADVQQLPFADGDFDAVVSERCLINLPSWDEQQKAILEIHRVLNPEGYLLLVEATEEGYRRLNSVRAACGLKPVEVVWHNRPLPYFELERCLTHLFHTLRGGAAFSTYYYLSRVVHPLIVAPEEPKYDARINNVARLIEEKLPIWKLGEGPSPLIAYRARK